MCEICSKVKTLPQHKALELIARAMCEKNHPSCLDKLVGEVLELASDGQDALDQEVQSLKGLT